MSTESNGMNIDVFIQTFSSLVRNLAWKVIRCYSGWFNDAREEVNDLYAAGMLELVGIYHRINFLDKGYKSYIIQRVRGCMLNYVYKNIPFSEYEKTDDGQIQLRESGGRIRQFTRTVSIDDIVETSCEPEDDLQIETLLFRHQVQSLIAEFMAGLSSVERFILISRFQDEKTYEEIGGVTGMRRETVSRKISEILKKLGKFLRLKCSWRLSQDDISDYLQNTDLGIRIIVEEDNPPSAVSRRIKYE